MASDRFQPSIQKLVAGIAQDSVTCLNEEATSTQAYTLSTPRLDAALRALESEASGGVNQQLLEECLRKAPIRVARREAIYRDTVSLYSFAFYFP